ncbi:Uncharacterized protein FKW44_003690, partial [Caligus rogercresseyi]
KSISTLPNSHQEPQECQNRRVAPWSPDANPLDHAFWPHIESKTCKLRHPNIAALKAA